MWQDIRDNSGNLLCWEIFDDLNHHVGTMTIKKEKDGLSHFELKTTKQAQIHGGMRAISRFAYYDRLKGVPCLFYEGISWNGDKVTINDCVWDHAMRHQLVKGVVFKDTKVGKTYYITKAEFEAEATKLTKRKDGTYRPKDKTHYQGHPVNRLCNDQQYVVRLNKFKIL